MRRGRCPPVSRRPTPPRRCVGLVRDFENKWKKSTTKSRGSNLLTRQGKGFSGSVCGDETTTTGILLVSDLDGTMVGSSDAADAATLDFREYWLSEQRVRKSLLVFSTGRTLEQYLELKREKGETLCEPDYLICAVGTRVYEKGMEGNDWVENAKWRAKLEDNWCKEAVSKRAEGLIQAYGESNVHLRPTHEQNSHKITCGVRSELVEDCCEELAEKLGEDGVSAKLVYSGKGDWKYLDILSASAGKLESLEFLRKMTRFSPENTIACGDSGNDIAMLEGENKGIIVGNAQPDLTTWYEKHSESQEHFEERVVFTKGTFASGILEGLGFFDVL